MNWLSEHWPIVVVFLIPGLFGALVLWYQPAARHEPFAAGQVWKNDAGFSMKIATVSNSRWLVVKKTTPDGGYSMIDYPAEDFRRLIIKNRYKLV